MNTRDTNNFSFLRIKMQLCFNPAVDKVPYNNYCSDSPSEERVFGKVLKSVDTPGSIRPRDRGAFKRGKGMKRYESVVPIATLARKHREKFEGEAIATSGKF